MKWLTPSAARAYTGMCRRTLARLADQGMIECWRSTGGWRRYSVDSLDAYMQGNMIVNRAEIRKRLR